LTSLTLEARQYSEFNDISENGKLSFHKLKKIITEQTKKEYQTYSDFYSVKGEVCVYSHKEDIFVHIFLNDPGAPKFVNKKFLDFHYQDQADPWFDIRFSQGKLTKEQHKAAQKEWNIREKTWKTIFNNWKLTPAEAGLLYEMCDGMDFYNITKNICQVFKEKNLL